MAPVAGQITSDNLTEVEAVERAGLLVDLSYGIDLELSDDPAAPTFRSSTRIGVSCRRPGADTFLNLTVGEQGRLRQVRVGGQPCPSAVAGYDGARIPLAGLPVGRAEVA